MFSFERPTVFVLLRPRRPATVFWRVIAIVVDAVEREAERFFAHVGKKIFKTVKPPIANLDPATTVIFELFNSWIVAAGFHVGPRTKRGAPTAGRMAVGVVKSSGKFFDDAATRLRVATTQVTRTDVGFFAACASTFPMNDRNAWRTAVSVRNTENSQTAKILACDIIEFGHRAAPIGSKSSDGQTLPGLAVALL